MAIATVSAFRSDAGVTMSRGLSPFRVSLTRVVAEAARVVGRRGDHVQRFHAEHGDEGLHGVVGEHAPAAALSGTGVERHARARRGVGVTRHLKRRDQVDAFAALRIGSGLDRAVGQDHGRLVVLEDGRERADRRLVAGDDGDQSLHLVRVQVGVERVVRELPADQGVPHAVGAVRLSVGHADGVGGRDQPDRQIVAANPRCQCRLYRVDLSSDAEVALAVTKSPVTPQTGW
jgi:hypothetical protein